MSVPGIWSWLHPLPGSLKDCTAKQQTWSRGGWSRDVPYQADHMRDPLMEQDCCCWQSVGTGRAHRNATVGFCQQLGSNEGMSPCSSSRLPMAVSRSPWGWKSLEKSSAHLPWFASIVHSALLPWPAVHICYSLRLSSPAGLVWRTVQSPPVVTQNIHYRSSELFDGHRVVQSTRWGEYLSLFMTW